MQQEVALGAEMDLLDIERAPDSNVVRAALEDGGGVFTREHKVVNYKGTGANLCRELSDLDDSDGDCDYSPLLAGECTNAA